MDKEILLDILANKDWSSLDEIIRELDKADYWDAEFIASAVEHAKKARLRGELNKHRDADGIPKFVSVLRTNEKGEEERVYKQESLFDVGDRKQAINYHVDRIRHHFDMAKHHQKRAFEQHRVQLALPFDLVEKIRKATR